MTSNCSDTKAIADPKNNYQKGTNAILRINLHTLTIDYIFTYVATKTNNKSIQANFNVRLHSGCVGLMLNNREVQELIDIQSTRCGRTGNIMHMPSHCIKCYLCDAANQSNMQSFYIL